MESALRLFDPTRAPPLAQSGAHIVRALDEVLPPAEGIVREMVRLDDGQQVLVSRMGRLTKDARIALFIRGFLRGPLATEPLFSELVGQTHDAALCVDLHPSAWDPNADVPLPFRNVAAQWGRAQTLLEVLRELGVENLDVIAHSEGGLIATYAALQQETRMLARILLLNSAGLADLSLGGLFGKYLLLILQYLAHEPGHGNTPVGKQMSRAARIEGRRHLREGWRGIPAQLRGLADARIEKWIRELVTRYGVDVGILHGRDDVLFRVTQVLAAAERIGIPATVIDGPHDAIRLRPEQTMAQVRILHR